MKPTKEIIDIVSRVPDLDKSGKVHGVSWEDSIPLYEEIFKRGAAGIRQVAGMLVEVDDGRDYKPRYLLHALGVYCGRPEMEKQRGLFARALADELDGELSTSAKGYLLRQLQVAGGEEVVGAIGGHLLDEENWEYAAQALVAIGGEAATEQLRKALAAATDKPAQLTTAAQSLGVLGDKNSAATLRKLLSHDEADICLVAARGLAGMGDRASMNPMLALADRAKGYERQRATGCCLLLAERLGNGGREIYQHLADTRKNPDEAYVRDLAEFALKDSKTEDKK